MKTKSKEAMFKVMIAKSGYPTDFYLKRIEGDYISSMLTTMRVSNELRYTLDKKHLKKCIAECNKQKFDILHLTTHCAIEDNEKDNLIEGVALTDNSGPRWPGFAKMFDRKADYPTVLAMSACWGAAAPVVDAFTNISMGPAIIIGPTVKLNFSDFAAAWPILYYRFKIDGITKSSTKTAVKQINIVLRQKLKAAQGSFICWWWNENENKYISFPDTDRNIM